MSKINGNWWKGIILVFLLGLIVPSFIGIFRTGKLVATQEHQERRIAKVEDAIEKLTEVASDMKAIKTDIQNIKETTKRLERR